MRMVEKVARAMAENAGFNWENCAQSQWESDATAAIKAMREPTDQMTVYGLECLPEGRHMTGAGDVQTMWRSMVDVATDSHG